MLSVAVVEPDQIKLVDVPEPVHRALPGAGPHGGGRCLCNATDGKLVAGHFPGVGRTRCCSGTSPRAS